MTKAKIGKTIEIVIMAVLILLVGTLLFNRFVLHQDNVKLFGYSHAVVVSGSMIPAIQINDLVIYKAFPKEEYKVGDIVIYQGTDKRICHRIISIDGEALITKGDANSVADPPIGQHQLLGKVIKIIPKVGGVLQGMGTPMGIGILVVLLLATYVLPGLFRRKKVENQ